MKTVYLIRHGRPNIPEGKRICLGRTDLPMGPEGFRQASKAAEKLALTELSVFSSPLIRCLQTAKALNRPITILDGLKELDLGQWDGLDFETIEEQFPDLYEARGRDLTVLPPGAETHEEGLKRFQAALQKAAESSPGDLAVITHGGVISLLLKAITGEMRKPAYAEIIVLKYYNGTFNI